MRRKMLREGPRECDDAEPERSQWGASNRARSRTSRRRGRSRAPRNVSTSRSGFAACSCSGSVRRRSNRAGGRPTLDSDGSPATAAAAVTADFDAGGRRAPLDETPLLSPSLSARVLPTMLPAIAWRGVSAARPSPLSQHPRTSNDDTSDAGDGAGLRRVPGGGDGGSDEASNELRQQLQCEGMVVSRIWVECANAEACEWGAARCGEE